MSLCAEAAASQNVDLDLPLPTRKSPEKVRGGNVSAENREPFWRTPDGSRLPDRWQLVLNQGAWGLPYGLMWLLRSAIEGGWYEVRVFDRAASAHDSRWLGRVDRVARHLASHPQPTFPRVRSVYLGERYTAVLARATIGVERGLPQERDRVLASRQPWSPAEVLDLLVDLAPAYATLHAALGESWSPDLLRVLRGPNGAWFMMLPWSDDTHPTRRGRVGGDAEVARSPVAGIATIVAELLTAQPGTPTGEGAFAALPRATAAVLGDALNSARSDVNYEALAGALAFDGVHRRTRADERRWDHGAIVEAAGAGQVHRLAWLLADGPSLDAELAREVWCGVRVQLLEALREAADDSLHHDHFWTPDHAVVLAEVGAAADEDLLALDATITGASFLKVVLASHFGRDQTVSRREAFASLLGPALCPPFVRPTRCATSDLEPPGNSCAATLRAR